MDILAVAEPELVDAARARARRVEIGDRLRLLRPRHVEQIEAGGLLAGLLRLVGDGEQVAADLQAVGAHEALRQRGLHDHARVARVAHVEAREVLRRALVRGPEDTPPVGRDLDRQPLAHAAETVELVMREELEVPQRGMVVRVHRRSSPCRRAA